MRLPHRYHYHRRRNKASCSMCCRPKNHHNPSNIGSIVKVLRKHPNQYIIPDEIGQFIWMVEGSHLLTYTKGGRTYRQKRGAVPDSYLKPIKGQPSNDQLVTGQPEQMQDRPKQKRNKSATAKSML